MSLEAGRLPASFVIGEGLRAERGGRTQAYRDIETTGPEAGGDKGVEKVIRIDGPVQRDFTRGIHKLGQLVISQRRAVLNHRDIVLGPRLGISRADLELKTLRQLEAHLTERRIGR